MNKKIESIVVTLLLVAGSGFVLLPVNADPNPGENELMFCGPGDTTGTYIDVTVGDTDLHYDFYAKLLNETDTISASGNQSAYVEWTPADALNYSDAVLGDIFQNTSVSKLPGTNFDNDAGWIRDLMWGDTSSHNSTEGHVFNMTWDALKVGTVTIYHNDSQTAYAGEYCPTTLRINGEIRIHPQDPSSFTIADEGPDWFNLSWGSAEGIDQYVVVQNKNNIPTDPTDGTEIYNNTGSWYNDTGLDIEDDYYYSIWGYNTSEGYFSLNYDSLTKDSSNGLPTPLTVSTVDKNNIQLSWTCQYEDAAILRPNDNGTSAEWTANTAYNWQAVDDSTSDGTTTLIQTTTDDAWDSYNIESYSVGKPIKEVKIVANMTAGGTGEYAQLAFYNGVSTQTNIAFEIATSFTEYTYTLSSNPWTLSDWTISDLNDLEIGVIAETAGGFNNQRCTQIYLEVTYHDTPDYVIERHSSATWSQGTGTEVFNSTTDGDATSYLDSGLWPDTDYYYQLWTYDDSTNNDLYSTDYLAGNDHTTDNINIVIDNENPTDNTLVIDRTLSQVTVDITDGNGDTIDFEIHGDYITTATGTDVADGTYSADIAIDENEPYGEDIIWYVNATDGFDWTNVTYNFTFRDEYEPTQPADFTATTVNRTQIDLSWTKVTHGEYTYVERYATEGPHLRDTGTEVYNGTGTAFSDDDGSRLDFNTQYYYQAWSYNVTDDVYSPFFASANNTTDDNTYPAQPTSVEIHNDDYVSVYDAYFNVSVYDADGDDLDVLA